MNFREKLKQAILNEFPQAANLEVELEKYLDEAVEAHEAHPAIEISTFVVDFASPRGYYDELSPTLDYSKPMSESYLKTPVQPMSDEDYYKRLLKGIDLSTFIVPDVVEDDFIVSESISGKEVIKLYNGELEIRTLTAENGETAEVVMDNTPTHRRPTRTHFVDHESKARLENLLGDTKPNKALLAEIMKCGYPARGGGLLVTIAAFGNKSSLPKSNPIGCEANNEKLVDALIKSRNLSSELEYNYGKGVDPTAFKIPETFDIIKPKQTYMTATVKRKRCKTFTNDLMGTQRIKKYVTSMLPKGSDCYHVALRNDQGIEVFIMLPNRNILSEIVGAKVDNVIRIPTNTPRRLHAFSKYKVLTPYKVVATTRFHDATNRIMEEIHNPQTSFNEWE